MLLGIDYGTTRTVVVAVDRGNYPIISFQTDGGDAEGWYPSLIAVGEDQILFGLDAAARQNDLSWHMLRSFKRNLSRLGPQSLFDLGNRTVTAIELLTGFLARLRADIYERSNLRIKSKEALEAVVSVPANSNSNQRFITLEAFVRAGFTVRGLINEPSAAGLEYAHLYMQDGSTARRENVVVYDLGGGTFDASVISMAERRHEVLGSDGIAQLGGDDFDRILLEMAIEEAGIKSVTKPERAILLEECREKKEGLHPNTRKVAIDLGRAIEGEGEIVILTSQFYDRCRPLVEETIEAMERSLKSSTAADWNSVAAVYMVGGSSDLPIVARLLRERYGRYVRKSPYPHAATAIGLAIAADKEAGYKLRERFTRHFGVWREAEDGRAISFDVLFEKDTLLPESPEEKLTRSRRYLPAHNLGHFRYLECSQLDEQNQPAGDMMPWDEVYFPFDSDLEDEADIEQLPVKRMSASGQEIEEIYSCDSRGIIEVSIGNRATGHSRTFRLRENRR